MNQLVKLVALLALSALGILTTLGSWWFAFAIWPVSWSASVFFGVCQLILSGLITAISQVKT